LEAPLSANEVVRPWRRATIVASLIAAVELGLLVVCGAALFGRPLAQILRRHAEQTAAAPHEHAAPARKHPAVQRPAPPPAKPSRPRARTSVLVLNGNGRDGAAHAEAAKLQSLGYRIAATADARRTDYATSVVMYKRGYRPEAARLAHDLHIGVVGPLDGIPPVTLAGGQLAVIVGAG
jgi:hypothetical protein